VSLEGTLETIALPDVLALLSVTAKTGELRIEAGGGVGSVWLETGRVAGFDVGGNRTVVDALFALLRLREGTFRFHTGTQPYNPMEPAEVAPLLEEAESRLMQWPAIAAVVPSLHCELSLQESVDGTVMLRPDQWRLVVTIGGGHTVAEVLGLRGLGEFDGTKALKELVDLRLVGVKPGESPLYPEMQLSAPRPEVTSAADAMPLLTDVAVTAAGAGAAVGTGSAVGTDAMWPDGLDEEIHETPEVTNLTDLSEIWNDETGDVESASLNGASDTLESGATGSAEAVDEEEPAPPAPEPVNRGLLLKFLGSARN